MTPRTIQMLLVMMASLSTLAATDIFLPSLPSMAAYFGASENATQLTIPLYLLGSLLAAPLLGILSDHYGRRPVMLFGMALFLCGTAICIYSPSLSLLLSGRFIQGFGAIVVPVVGWAFLQDLYPKDEGTRVMTWVGSANCVAPLVAPGLGGYIHMAFGWQGNFLLLFLFGVTTLILMLFSKPTLKSISKKEKLSPSHSLKTYGRIITHTQFLVYTHSN
ncbi:MAG: MFS transporter [Alphaproteobacteria bacterium]|nr:MFS transporter [Alphaproteobacteria bacterium]